MVKRTRQRKISHSFQRLVERRGQIPSRSSGVEVVVEGVEATEIANGI